MTHLPRQTNRISKNPFYLKCYQCGCLVLALWSPTVFAQASDYDQGVQLFQAGQLPQAIQSFAKGAKQGDSRAQFAYGSHLYFGEGIAQDMQQGVVFLNKSSAQGYAPADAVLGFGYLSGQGVTQNTAKAAAYLQKAAMGCQSHAQNTLAHLMYKGEGVAVDKTGALAMLYIAQQLQHPEANKGVAKLESELPATEVAAAKTKSQNLASQMKCVE